MDTEPLHSEARPGRDGSDLSEASPLAALAGLADELEADDVAREARQAAERVSEGLFNVAFVGQFKRGKSTLVNALLGRPVLPAGVTPITSVVTVVRHGVREAVRIRFVDGRSQEIEASDLVAYVSEQHNPENAMGVVAAEVFEPSPLLSSGMCLVDTPGLGSVFEGNTEATKKFVPHIDAALVVLGSDPPISGEELALVADVARQVKELIFVLNKADRMSEAETEEAARFTEGVLARRLARPISRLFRVSASEVLGATGPERDWPALRAVLGRLAHESGTELVREAESRESARLSTRIVAEVDEQRGALLRPVEESERRLAELGSSLAEAERAMTDLGYLLQAEVDRFARRVQEERDRFLAEALPAAAAELHANARDADAGRRIRSVLREVSRGIARRRLDAWLGEGQRAAETSYRLLADRFLVLANDFLARFIRSGELGEAALPPPFGSEAGLRERSHLYFTELMAVTAPPPMAWLFDRLLPIAHVRRSTKTDAYAVLERLLSSNASRVQNDLIDRVRESRRKLEAEIRERLSGALRSAAAALERGRAKQAAGAESVGSEVARLNALRARAEALTTQTR